MRPKLTLQKPGAAPRGVVRKALARPPERPAAPTKEQGPTLPKQGEAGGATAATAAPGVASGNVSVEPVLLREFHFVWITNQGRPRKRHASLASALTEAERLRALYPASQVLVYRAECVGGMEERKP